VVFEKLEELVLLELGDLDLSHGLGVILEEFLQACEVAVAQVGLDLVEEVFEGELREEVILFEVQMILCIIILRTFRHLHIDYHLLRRILQIYNLLLRLNHDHRQTRMLGLISSSHLLRLFILADYSFLLLELLLLVLGVQRVCAFCSGFFKFYE